MAHAADFSDLEFIRARLNVLGERRRHRPLTESESREFRDLVLRELTLLAEAPLPRTPRRRSRPPRHA